MLLPKVMESAGRRADQRRETRYRGTESTVRLVGIDIEDFRSIHDQRLPAEGLVVLLGPNSAGKTSVLEAARELAGGSGTAHRADPGEPESPYAVGTLWLDLPAAGGPSSEEAETIRRLLCGEDSDGWEGEGPAWEWLGPRTTRLLQGATAPPR